MINQSRLHYGYCKIHSSSRDGYAMSCVLVLTLNVEMGLDFRRSVTVFSNACVFTSLFASNSLVKEEQIVRAHFLAFEKPMIIGLGIGFGSAKDFIWRGAFAHFDVSFRNFDIFRRICKDIFFVRETCITTKYGFNVIIIHFTTSSRVVSFVFWSRPPPPFKCTYAKYRRIFRISLQKRPRRRPASVVLFSSGIKKALVLIKMYITYHPDKNGLSKNYVTFCKDLYYVNLKEDRR